jgi:hypothetical protein
MLCFIAYLSFVMITQVTLHNRIGFLELNPKIKNDDSWMCTQKGPWGRSFWLRAHVFVDQQVHICTLFTHLFIRLFRLLTPKLPAHSFICLLNYWFVCSCIPTLPVHPPLIPRPPVSSLIRISVTWPCAQSLPCCAGAYVPTNSRSHTPNTDSRTKAQNFTQAHIMVMLR